MDFEQYFNSTPYGKYHKAKSAARDSWDTCKEEILSILINYRSNPLGYKDDKWNGWISDEVIDKIKNL